MRLLKKFVNLDNEALEFTMQKTFLTRLRNYQDEQIVSDALFNAV